MELKFTVLCKCTPSFLYFVPSVDSLYCSCDNKQFSHKHFNASSMAGNFNQVLNAAD